jgi:hypothetical protein
MNNECNDEEPTALANLFPRDYEAEELEAQKRIASWLEKWLKVENPSDYMDKAKELQLVLEEIGYTLDMY